VAGNCVSGAPELGGHDPSGGLTVTALNGVDDGAMLLGALDARTSVSVARSPTSGRTTPSSNRVLASVTFTADRPDVLSRSVIPWPALSVVGTVTNAPPCDPSRISMSPLDSKTLSLDPSAEF
jgi:hypothetical protein